MYDFTESILHSYVGEAVLYGAILLLIISITVWVITSIIFMFKANRRFEPLRDRDKNEFYFLVKSALYKAVTAYERGEKLGDSPDKPTLPPPPPEPNKKEEKAKKVKVKDKGGHGFRKNPKKR